jgi:hypothetical protein
MNAATRNTVPAKAGDRGEVSLTLTLSPPAYDLLQDLATRSDQPADDVIRRALGLLKLSYDALQEGKHVGFTTDASALETEVVF